MGDSDSSILVEDMVQYAMRQRNKNWKRAVLNIADDDPDIERFFTPEIGKAVLYFAKLESWNYMDVVDFFVQELKFDVTYCYGKFSYCMRVIGMDYLDWDRKETFFSYCAFIVEVCYYCFEKGHDSLIEAAILASGISISRKLNFGSETDRGRYDRYAVEYNKVYEEIFPPGEPFYGLSVI